MRLSSAALLLALLNTAPAAASSGGSPITLSHSGYVLDALDAPVAGPVSLTFRLYTAASGGTLEWAGTCANVPVAAGYYAVSLGGTGCPGSGGSGDAILDTSDLPPGTPRFLEVELANVILLPRLVIDSAPTAALASRALTADLLGTHAASDFALSGHSHTLADVASLQAALDAKLPASAASGFALSAHSHAVADVTALQAALDAKLPASALGALQEGKWCTVSGGKVVCTSDAPQAPSTLPPNAGAAPATCAPGTQGYLWYDTGAGALKLCNGAVYVNIGTVTPPPVAPTGLAGVAGPQQIALTWNTAANAASYEVGYDAGAALTASPIIVSVAGNTASLTGLTNNQLYTLAVRSVSGQWRSSWSATIQATPIPNWNCTTDPGHAGCVSSSAFASCNAIRSDPLFIPTDGDYFIDPDGATGNPPFLARCGMTTDSGGWTLVMRFKNDNTLRWQSSYWTDATLFNESGTSLDPTLNANAKFTTWTRVTGTTLRACKGGGTTSADCYSQAWSGARTPQTLFNESYKAGSLSRATMQTIFGNDSGQPYCNQSGINLTASAYTASRFGLSGNNENDCATADASWGIGTFAAQVQTNGCGIGLAAWSVTSVCVQGSLWIK